jgi:type VI protein secretion system component VasF
MCPVSGDASGYKALSPAGEERKREREEARLSQQWAWSDSMGEVVVAMLWTIAVILLVLWLLGLITGTTVSGFIHVLLVLAVIAIVIQLISGRRAV